MGCDENDTLVDNEFQFILVFKLDFSFKNIDIETYLEPIKQLAKNVKFRYLNGAKASDFFFILTTGAIYISLLFSATTIRHLRLRFASPLLSLI